MWLLEDTKSLSREMKSLSGVLLTSFQANENF